MLVCFSLSKKKKKTIDRENHPFSPLFRLLYLMSTKSSFQRNSMNGLFPSLLNPDNHPSSSSGTLSSNITFSPDYASASQQRLAPESTGLFRHQQRPVSEILNHESSISPESIVWNHVSRVNPKLTSNF